MYYEWQSKLNECISIPKKSFWSVSFRFESLLTFAQSESSKLTQTTFSDVN